MKNKPYLFIVRGTHERSKGRGKRIIATSYRNALNTIAAKYPNKLIQTKFAKPMDLISAKVEAAKASRVEGRTIYINVKQGGKEDGECFLHHKADNTTCCAYSNGSQLKQLPKESMDNEIAPPKIIDAKISGLTPKPLPINKKLQAKLEPEKQRVTIPAKIKDGKVVAVKNITTASSSKVTVDGTGESAKTKSPSTKNQNNKVMATVVSKTAKKVSTPAKESKKPAAKTNRPAVSGGKTVTMTAKQLRAEVVAGNVVFNSKGTSIPMSKRAAEEPAKKYEVTVKANGKVKEYYFA